MRDQRVHGKCCAANSGGLLLQAYLESASQPGFDGPFIVELTILRTLNKVHSQLNTHAYRHYFHDLRPADLERAKQLTEDPYMLIKFKVGSTSMHVQLCTGLLCRDLWARQLPYMVV